jgi:hypothetical protein
MADGILKVGQIQTSSGSGTITIGQSGETISIPSGCTITNSGTQTGFGGTNTPAFSVRQSSAQTGIANNTQTIVTFDTEEFDTDNAFASNKFTVPSGKAGKYFFCATLLFLSGADWEAGSLGIYKNGTVVDIGYGRNLYYNSWKIATVVDLAVSDYIELKCYQNSGGSLNLGTGRDNVNFQGFKLL